ncbi:hypothetical protein SAV14893_030670 [Streptomyces avermitilis]|uniref:Uncharacterized protein n=2 Tax=Streptomyces avermitilis TaxID=33903 RepID=A0A4D4MVF3_STRAX|nr:hypothetical protein SAV14893_030670 [Streptomyces avermitilis]GDY76182.1 hypothetical protein SAV31267_056670 [Streptomyces avermitilis]GDY85130.1 hypothetical protein SAVCW2_43290 [Streptomyces avermitilis]
MLTVLDASLRGVMGRGCSAEQTNNNGERLPGATREPRSGRSTYQGEHDPMEHIVTVQEAVTAFADWMEPTDGELDAIEAEMPRILADVEALDVQIALLDQAPTELDERRARRGRRRVLSERATLANRAVSGAVA